MPITPTYPGVYVQEIPSGVRTVVGVETSIAAFVGSAPRGPTDKPITLHNFGDFERVFGGLEITAAMSYNVANFYLNGGGKCVVVRVANEGTAKKSTIDAGGLKLEAIGEGKWGNNLVAEVNYETSDQESSTLFNLIVREIVKDEDGDEQKVSEETWRNVSVIEDHPRYVRNVIDENSQLVNSGDEEELPAKPGSGVYASAGEGVDGENVDDTDMERGISSLETVDLFNILCLSASTRKGSVTPNLYGKAAAFCYKQRAVLLCDPEFDSSKTVDNGKSRMKSLRDAIGKNAKNAAFFFPNVRMPDALKENVLQEFMPSGAIAGIVATTDANRGVWKAPAGIEAGLVGVNEFTFPMTDDQNGMLNPLGINCLRNFPVYGNIVWGSRTIAGADALASEWKYLPVRRTALFIEESLFRGTKWVVFEPNDEPLWAEIRMNVGAFMQNLFRQGAFQGSTPRDAYFVRCGEDTTTQNDINLGIVNIEVGFAPLKPAEFVIIKIQQMTGDIET